MAERTLSLTAVVAAAGPGAILMAADGGPGDLASTGDTAVLAIVSDSRAVSHGALFCCVPGLVTDGHTYAARAVDAGAVALLVDRRLPIVVPQIVVPNVRAAMATIAAAFYGNPSEDLMVVGVTGTNGKTTTAELLRQIFVAADHVTEVSGTLTGERTTPEAPVLQARLAGWRDAGVTAVAMEVSSHALAQHRSGGIHFRAGVFTNLSRDHLDYHETEESYFAAKARLFEPATTDRAIVNLDDSRGRLLSDAAQIPTEGFRLADATEVEFDISGTAFTWRGRRMRVGLAGKHNLSNALAAATTAAALGIDLDAIEAGLAVTVTVPGRFEAIPVAGPFTVVVDFAHTPDALANVLDAARELISPPGRVIVVFGAGGDRDKTKRAPMGEAAANGADLVVLTSDNPRSEDPLEIIDDVRSGFSRSARQPEIIIEAERREAIAAALRSARDGDLVLIAGKGHESSQEIGATSVPFDDRRVALELLAALGDSA